MEAWEFWGLNHTICGFDDYIEIPLGSEVGIGGLPVSSRPQWTIHMVVTVIR